MSLIERNPMGQKAGKARANPRYLERVRALNCCVCEAFGEPQLSPTTAHHPIHGRYSQRKADDEMAIPLCEGHHQGLWDQSKVAIHKEPSKWRRLYGEDREYSDGIKKRLQG